MASVHFIFGLHNHQPIGNFDHVFEYAYNRAYKPILETLEKYKEMKMALHYTGPLLEWLERKHPEHLELLKDLIQRNQVEIVISGFYEPVLASIPTSDRQLQLRIAKEYAKKLGYNPKGVWITERFWEPALARDIAQAGLSYAIVDDHHFLSAGLRKEDLYSYFLTEYDGHSVAVFPIDEYLRYLTPFRPVERTIKYLKDLASKDYENILVVVHDDGEKYGVWPGTYEWVHGKKWLDEFFDTILSCEEVIVTTYSEYMEKYPPSGIVYLPTTSYFEMSEWSLPATQAKMFVEFVNTLKESGIFSKYRVFVKGGIWKNFFYKYPESNYMHKRMLFLSRLTRRSLKAKMYVLRAQCNDAYWHGVFGGVYLPHLREAIWRNLIMAHNIVAKGMMHVKDIDMDGEAEILYEAPNYFITLKPHYGGSVVELSSREKFYNYVDVIARRYEHYHDILEAAVPQEEGGGVESIHELKKEIPPEIKKELFYDTRLRYMFQDHILPKESTIEDFYASRIKEPIELYKSKYEIAKLRHRYVDLRFYSKIIKVSKTFELLRDTVIVTYKVTSPKDTFFGVELNVGVHAKKEKLDQLENVSSFEITDDVFGKIQIESTDDVILWKYPIKTLSQSESGWDFIQQGASYTMLYPLREGEEKIFRIYVREI